MNTAAERYRDRFRKVLEFIDAHLHEDLDVTQLSSVAAFSKFHFHRQFSMFLGISVDRYVRLTRLKRASYQLAFRDWQPVIDVALDAGYEGPEAFARAFRKNFGQSPSEFRKQPQWEPWHVTCEPLNALRTEHMQPTYDASQVRIVDFPQTRVATLEHRGDPALLGDSIRKFMDWRRQNHLPPQVSATFNIAYDDPATTEPAAYRFDLCAATDRPVEPNAHGVVVKHIPAGRCAVLRHRGSDDTLIQTVRWLYSQWLPQSDAELRDFPLYFQRVRFFPEVAEHEAEVDVFLPIR
ncbi:MAG TPA: AraC family transcriptional regulator [Povalibacter sp.]|nr:AraC family transcriptional regulator [Povalibacter sp.]